MPPLPEAPPRPTEIPPPCPGCPEPDAASQIDRPCSGPGEVNEPGNESSHVESFAGQVCAAACMGITYCPRVTGHRIAPNPKRGR